MILLVTKLQVLLILWWLVSPFIEGNATFQLEVSENKDFLSLFLSLYLLPSLPFSLSTSKSEFWFWTPS